MVASASLREVTGVSKVRAEKKFVARTGVQNSSIEVSYLYCTILGSASTK